MSANKLLHLTLTELSETLNQRRASPVDLVHEVLARVEEVDGKLNSLVVRRDPDQMLSEAREAEARIARGEGRPLEGIPFGVKDLEDVAGMVSSHGSKLYADRVPEVDSTQVARLKAAGAIVAGKTNAPEFGHTAVTKNFVYGVTLSPWSDDRTPGGSSGGSAAALAGEVLPLVTASDGGGSIRIPASFVGAYGHKSSFGRIPTGPMQWWEYHATVCYGPLTKCVRDAALVLDQTAGFDPHDPRSLPHPGISYLQEVDKPLDRLRIAYCPDLGYAVVQSDVAQVVDDAVKVFGKLGHAVKEISGGPPNLCVDWGLQNAFELGGHIAQFRPDRDSEVMQGLLSVIDLAKGLDQKSYGEISRRRVELVNWCARIFSEYDLLLTPTVPYDPPPPKGPFPSETEGRRQGEASAAHFTAPFNMSWHPAATVRAGFSRAGLPVGLQIVAPHHRDDLLLRAARAFERERPWVDHWPLR